MSKRPLARALALLALPLALTSSLARADEARLVRGTAVRLSDVVSELPAEVTDFEIGAAPPPGSSRTISKGDIVDAASKSGVSVKQVKLPLTVRVTSAAKRWNVEELAGAATPELLKALPNGVSVKHAKALAKAVTSPSATISAVRVPKLPRREGEYLTTAMIELSNDGQVVARIPLQLALDISGAAAMPTVTKGARLQLIIEMGPARVSATAIALSDGELGDTLQFRVAATQKILYGKVEQPTLARVVQ
ncbi:MAG TPA: flagella basal body P-ring formation protein FlgA [Polyangiaceae bacterium]|nr:flagella basal body P-ring formation protein FlgA [Polyangiaceae bacterium]